MDASSLGGFISAPNALGVWRILEGRVDYLQCLIR